LILGGLVHTSGLFLGLLYRLSTWRKLRGERNKVYGLGGPGVKTTLLIVLFSYEHDISEHEFDDELEVPMPQVKTAERLTGSLTTTIHASPFV